MTDNKKEPNKEPDLPKEYNEEEDTQTFSEFMKAFAKSLFSLETLKIFTPALIIVLLGTVVFGNYKVPSGSMIPTLNVENQVIGIKLFKPEPQKNDVVVFTNVNNWFEMPEDTLFIKRVIATEGDTISCCSPNGNIIINGKETNEPYLGTPNTQFTEQTVPAGHIFVMGDNRENSGDSRYFIDTNQQFIPVEAVEAKALAVYFPFTDMKTL